MEPSRYRSRSFGMAATSSKKVPYALLLLLALGAAALSVVILHKMRERRVLGLLLQERDQQLLSLHLLLQKEKAFNQETRRKVEALKSKASFLRTQRSELKNKLTKSESAATELKNIQKELEAALREKEKHINQLRENAADSSNDQIASLTELLKQKEAEIEEMKNTLSNFQKAQEKDASSESTPVYRSNKNTTPGTVVLDKHTNVSDVGPPTMEGKDPASANANETGSSHQEDISTEQQWVRFTTNMEDDSFQGKTMSDVGASLDDVPEEHHSEKLEVPRRKKKRAHGKKAGKRGKLHVRGQSVETQDQVTDSSRRNKILEKGVAESEEVSKDGIIEGNQKEKQPEDSTEIVENGSSTSEGKDDTVETDETKQEMNNKSMVSDSRSDKMEIAEDDAVGIEDAVNKESGFAATENS